MKMLIRILLFFCIIPIIISISNQEDLTISTYSHIACLILNPARQHLIDFIHINSTSIYQTFTTSNMTIELCFRLCRRTLILINSNHTNCMCLYTINTRYQLHAQLGELLSVNNCSSNALEIYSLSNDFNILPSLSTIYDWSFDGCYYLHGIQNYHPNALLTNEEYTQAIISCRERCQTLRKTGDFSFILSLKKSCYCLPIMSSKTILHTAVRKPLIHCSFLPYLKDSFSNSFNYSEVHSDTAVKIDVQHSCLSTFTYDRSLSLCLKLITARPRNFYSKTNPWTTCIPMLIKTFEQWKQLQSYSFVSNRRNFLWIDRNSTYIFDDLLPSKNISVPTDDLCIVKTQLKLDQLPSVDLLPCSTAFLSDYFLCVQKPLQTISEDNPELQTIQKNEQLPIVDNISCPIDFVSFNNMCYYVLPSFVYDIQSGEEHCSRKYSNSSLVKLNSHEWGNINGTEFLGRTPDDILLEFFYYQLEITSKSILRNVTSKKHWLRLLVGEKTSLNECVLRYFTRASGAFTILHRCADGGHPVCQCQPIQRNISKIILNKQTAVNILELNITTESTTTTIPTLVNSTTQLNISASDPVPDEDLYDNETRIDFKLDNNTSVHRNSLYSRYRPFLMISLAALLTPIIFIIGTLFFVRHIRRNHRSYSIDNNAISSSQRTRRSSTRTTSEDQSSTPTVVYTKLKSSPPSTTIDTDMSHPFDESIHVDDQIQLLPELITQATFSAENEQQFPPSTFQSSKKK
ncbi:hypothetical protein I4U23_002925 [Adineta vaga]|nr:hypothetical protein I4U23_002925 [Adineta vaga]